MDQNNQELEPVHDIWIDAYYLGDIALFKQYEHQQLQIIYEAKGVVENSLNRYEQIAHAVNNSVWKPQKPNITTEEFDFNAEAMRCRVSLKSENMQCLIQELWVFEQAWKVIEIRFCKPKRA